MRLIRWATAIAVSCSLVPAAAQSVLGDHYARGVNDFLGSSVAAAGDMDGDGTPDVLVGVPGADQVVVLSGVDLRRIRTFSQCAGCSFGEAVDSLDDVDGDLVPEVLVGAPNAALAAGSGAGIAAGTSGVNAGRVYLLSGATGRVLRTVDGTAASDFFGRSVSRGGDMDGDGREDFLVGAIGSDLGGDGSGSVQAFSADDGRRLWIAFGQAGDQLGHALDVLGLVDADQSSDVLVGAPGGNYVQVLSGATGEVLRHVDATAPYLQFGEALSAVGDLDDDRIPDFVASAPASFLPGGPGRVQVHSGADGTLLHAFQGFDHFGNAVSGVGDADGDGIGDVLVAARLAMDHPDTGQGQVNLYSGDDGHLIWSARGHCATGLFGQSVAGVGDLDDDGFADVVVGDPQALHAGTGRGQMRALSGRNGMWIDLGLGTAAFPCAPLLKASGTLQAGDEVGLHLVFAAPGKPSWIVAGTSTGLTPFGNGLLVPSLDLVVGPLATSPAGTLSVTGRWPDGIPPGIPFTFQVWVLEIPGVEGGPQDPLFQASNALTGVTP